MALHFSSGATFLWWRFISLLVLHFSPRAPFMLVRYISLVARPSAASSDTQEALRESVSPDGWSSLCPVNILSSSFDSSSLPVEEKEMTDEHVGCSASNIGWKCSSSGQPRPSNGWENSKPTEYGCVQVFLAHPVLLQCYQHDGPGKKKEHIFIDPNNLPGLPLKYSRQCGWRQQYRKVPLWSKLKVNINKLDLK